MFDYLGDAWADWTADDSDASDDFINTEIESPEDNVVGSQEPLKVLPLLEWRYRRRNLFDSAVVTFTVTCASAVMLALFITSAVVHEENAMMNINGGALLEWRYRQQNLLEVLVGPTQSTQDSAPVHRNGNGNRNPRPRNVFLFDSLRETLEDIEDEKSSKRRRLL